jgi:hypothetical protein
MFKIHAILCLALFVQVIAAGEPILSKFEPFEFSNEMTHKEANPFYIAKILKNMATNKNNNRIKHITLRVYNSVESTPKPLTKEEKNAIDSIIDMHFLEKLKNLYAITARSRFGR